MTEHSFHPLLPNCGSILALQAERKGRTFPSRCARPQEYLDWSRVEFTRFLLNNHELRKRVFGYRGELLCPQPNARPKPSRPVKHAKVAAGRTLNEPPYILERSQLIKMWNGD